MRNQVQVMMIPTPAIGGYAIHFLSTKLQGQPVLDLWFPVITDTPSTAIADGAFAEIKEQGKDITAFLNERVFKAIESIMVLHGVANNVTRICDTKDDSGKSIQFTVVYNERG